MIDNAFSNAPNCLNQLCKRFVYKVGMKFAGNASLQ